MQIRVWLIDHQNICVDKNVAKEDIKYIETLQKRTNHQTVTKPPFSSYRHLFIVFVFNIWISNIVNKQLEIKALQIIVLCSFEILKILFHLIFLYKKTYIFKIQFKW